MRLRPSSAHIWTQCAANPLFSSNVQYPEVVSDAAREGTCAAWVAERVIKGEFARCKDMVGKTHENGWLVTLEMAYYVQGYIDLMRSRGGTLEAEIQVELTPDIGGTLDSSALSWFGDTLFVDDLKYGFKLVEAIGNLQTSIYGGARLLQLNDPNIKFVSLGIYQPRAFHPDGIYRAWKLPVEEFWQHVQWIIQRGDECQKPNPIATPGPHCENCKAAATCVALAHSIYAQAPLVEDTRHRHMTAEELAAELEFLTMHEKLVTARKNAVFAEAEQRIKTEQIFGYRVKDRLGNRVFKVDAPAIHALSGISPMKTVLMSPAEFEAAGADKGIVERMTRRPVIGRKLEKMKADEFSKLFA